MHDGKTFKEQPAEKAERKKQKPRVGLREERGGQKNLVREAEEELSEELQEALGELEELEEFGVADTDWEDY